MTELERIREEMVSKFQNLWTVQTYEEKLKLADRILAIQGLCIEKDDQSLPCYDSENTPTYFESGYNIAQQDMLTPKDGCVFKKVRV